MCSTVRSAEATKAPKARALPKVWVSIHSYKKQPVNKFGVEYWALAQIRRGSPDRAWLQSALNKVVCRYAETKGH